MMIKRCLIVCSTSEGSRGAFQRTPEIGGGKKKSIFCKNVIQLPQMFRYRAFLISTNVGKQMIVLNYQIYWISNIKKS